MKMELPPISYNSKKFQHFYYCHLGDELDKQPKEIIYFQPRQLHEIIEQLQEEVIISANDNAISLEKKMQTVGCIVSYGETVFLNDITCAINLLFWPKSASQYDTRKCKYFTILYNYPKEHRKKKNFEKEFGRYGPYNAYFENASMQSYKDGMALYFAEIEQRKLKPLMYCLYLKNLLHLTA